MGCHKCGVVWEERWVQEVFDAGDVEATVLSERMVPVRQQDAQREREQHREPDRTAPMPVECLWRTMCMFPRGEDGESSHEL